MKLTLFSSSYEDFLLAKVEETLGPDWILVTWTLHTMMPSLERIRTTLISRALIML